MWVRMQSVAEARQWLEAGLLYESLAATYECWRLCDEASPQQLAELERDGINYVGLWLISDYAIYVED